MARARRGIGVRGPFGTRTAYFWGDRSWGGRVAGACHVTKAPEPGKHDGGGGGGDHHRKHHPHGNGQFTLTAYRTEETASASTPRAVTMPVAT
jgi:hypothetical protein